MERQLSFDALRFLPLPFPEDFSATTVNLIKPKDSVRSSQYDGGYSGRSWDRNSAVNINKWASAEGPKIQGLKPKAQPNSWRNKTRRFNLTRENILGKESKLRKYPGLVRSMITSTTR